MPRYLNTKGNPTLGIGLCDRCQRKFPLDELRPDGDVPGLMVCKDDWDSIDPYKLPPPQPDRISLPFVRPETPLDHLAEPVDYLVPSFLRPLLDAMNPAPSSARQALIIDVGQQLLDAGLWGKLDALWVMADYAQQPASLNWINPAANTLSPQGGYGFTADLGFLGNGVDAYINTNYIPGSGLYQLNSASVFFRSIGNITETATADVVNITSAGPSRSSLIRMFAAPSTSGSFGINAGATIGVAYGTAEGLFTARRLSGTDIEIFLNAGLLTTTAQASSSMPVDQMTLMAAVEFGVPVRFSRKRLGIAGVGAGLTDGDIANMSTIFDFWLDAVGAI